MRVSLHAGTFLLIVGSTVITIAGTDLVLPAVPGLPQVLGGSLAVSQLVLASFTAGSALGLLLFGELTARVDQRLLLVGSLAAYALTSFFCMLSPSLNGLVAFRFTQGITGSAAVVLAPVFLRELYGDGGALPALGALGSIESLVPAFAPVLGVWLLHLGGWRASFLMLGVLAVILCATATFRYPHFPASAPAPVAGGYTRLLRDPVFLRYSLSQACTLGALLVFVFGAPTVITTALSGTLLDFIFMQVSGIACFIVTANLTGFLVRRHDAESLIWWGTLTAALGAIGLLAFALAGGGNIRSVTALFLLLNTGVALRGPPGFHRAIIASRDDARGAALTAMAILLTVSGGTALIAPFIAHGLVPLAAGTVLLALSSAFLLGTLPALVENRH